MENSSKHYDPKIVEDNIYKLWEKNNCFNPDTQTNLRKNTKPFSIIMPPPNSNGSLHLGHAVFITLEDIMTRFHRMNGEPTLWLPGADHAGFETQVVFEKKLEKEGKSRFEFDRATLYQKMLDFTLSNKSNMEAQLKKLGASCDWSREKFTLDKDIIEIVYKTFKKLYDDKLAYRDIKPVNWCTKHQTSLSELEVKYIEQTDSLYYIKYHFNFPKLENGEEIPKDIIIATTRPETIFADVAIAVNPKDKKYKKLIGKEVQIPLTNRKIPIIADEMVDMKFGTGALKITPAHDITDFEIGKKHDLEFLSVIDERGKLTELAGEFAGLKVTDARIQVTKKLQDLGFIEKINDKYIHTVGHCYKCNRVIEPRIMPQWFIKTKPLAKQALAAIETKKIKFVSAKFAKIYKHWLTNIRDWNISRQIVWGIQIPAWYCKDCDHTIVSINSIPKVCTKCNSTNIYQDPDVFDTWFSSGQWPFAALKTNKKNDFKKFYPTSVMETGWDILFFWVARMVMLGIYVTGKVPFKTVYLHGLVRDKDRQKMSKSKGNVINPLAVAELYGSDAVRMALVFGTGAGNDTIVSEEKIRAMRNFANKIWNASKFVILNVDQKCQISDSQNLKAITEADKIVITKLKNIIKSTSKHINAYRFSQASQELYDFFWHNFCDKYLEVSKQQLTDPKLKSNTQQILLSTLTLTLTLLHPFMPFITEEIYQNLKEKYKLRNKLLIISNWPK